MKISSSITVLALALIYFSPQANAQSPFIGDPNAGGIYEPGTFRAAAANVGSSFRLPGSVWFSSNYADDGLGFQGSFLQAGFKNRLFEDALDGRWLFEGRANISEEGGFFGSIGIERIFSIDAAGADVSISGWFDYDDDTDAFAFANTLEQVGVSAQIKTQHWDLIANGYFPIGTSDETQGDPTGVNPFFENSLLLVPGIDSGLRGFDVTVRVRPSRLAGINGSFDFGGYGYDSDLVEFFGGGRVRTSFQLIRGAIVSGELNFDDRFDTTGILGLTFIYGAGGARGNEYSALARDFERTTRNDHIVRFTQAPVFAIDPDTGLPINVLHVNNAVGPGGAGTFEDPFDSLAAAEAAGNPEDIIFVNTGTGTSENLNGITLQDGQQLLGSSVDHLIPIANGGPFGNQVLVAGTGGPRPELTGDGFGGAAITIASDNTIRGFDIEGADAIGGTPIGIVGNLVDNNVGGIIEDVQIRDTGVAGIQITNLGGDFRFAGLDIQDSGGDGIFLGDANDPSSVFTFENNIVSNNGPGLGLGDGIEINSYDASAITFIDNITDGNGGSGVLLTGFTGNDAVGTDILFDNHSTGSNLEFGISVDDGAGNLSIVNSAIGSQIDPTFLTTGFVDEGNNLGGINIIDFQTPGTDQVLITDNDINSNGLATGFGPGINIELSEGITNAVVTGNQVDANGIGINLIADNSATGNPTTLNVSIIENESIGSLNFDPAQSPVPVLLNNQFQGIRALSDGDATLSFIVDQTSGNDLSIFGVSQNGIDLLAAGDSTLEAVIRNVDVFSSGGSGIAGATVDNGQLSLLVEDSSIGRDLDNILETTLTNAAFGFINDGNLNGITLNFDNEEGGRINTVIVQNTVLSDNVFSGLVLNSLAGTLTDLAVIDSTFDNPFLFPARTDGIFVVDGGNPLGNPDRGFGAGIDINVFGDAAVANPQVDSRTRLFFQGNTADRFTFDGIEVNTFGDASVLAEFTGNTLSTNGDGLDGGAQPDGPFDEGIEFNVFGSSSVNAVLAGNDISGNAGFQVEANTLGVGSTANILFDSNDLSTNFALGLPIDFSATTVAGSTLGLAFTNNAIDSGFFIPAGGITLELDGFSNGLTFANPFPAGVFAAPFGSIVQPAIDAEEAAFSLDGFPPAPPVFP